MLEKLRTLIQKYQNPQLEEIASFVGNQPIFFGKDLRLLSQEEILNYREELEINDELIPLIDANDNNFIVFDIRRQVFCKYSIADSTFFDDLSGINKYLEALKTQNS